MEAEDNGHGGYYTSTLNIVTCIDGQAHTLYSGSWDYAVGGGFAYYLFQQKGDQRLYAYTSEGDEWLLERYLVFGDTNIGTLEPYELLAHESRGLVVVNNQAYPSEVNYRQNGETISEADYYSAVDTLNADIKTVLMFSSMIDSSSDAFSNCPAMTFNQAIAQLDAFTGN